MSPQTLMRIAVVLMCLGICPFLLGLAWAANAISLARSHAPGAGAADAFLMIAVLLGAYGFAVIVAGGGTLLSYWVARRADVSVAGTSAVRIVVAVVLALPLFLVAAIQLPSI